MLIFLIVLIASLFADMASASVPLSWQVTPRNPAPVSFDRHHGETLEFRCTFTGFGELPFSGSVAVVPRLYYQTNGMAAAWWSVPASVSSNVLSATFPPSADPGADRLALFFGAPSNAYASAVLRLRHSPGFTPNVLPAPEPGYVEQDPTVPAWAKAETPPASGLDTNEVCSIVTNETATFSTWTLSANGTDFATGIEFDYDDEWHGWEMMEIRFGDNQVCYFDESIVWSSKDATTFSTYGNVGVVGQDLEDMWFGTITATRKRIDKNALGLARDKDMPQNNAVDEILLNGADGKIYHLRIGAGGSIDIYTEVTP